MRNKIFGTIGALWGGAIVVNGLFGKPLQGSDAYQTGQIIGIILGGVMLFVGVYYFFKKPNRETDKEKREQP